MCQYCGCEENSHIGRLMGEHNGLVNLAGDLRRATERGDDAEVQRLCALMKESFDVHAADEEDGIFHEMKQAEVLADKVEVLCHEHHDLHRYISAIADGDTDALVPFEHLLREHINAEDNGLFPAANIELDGLAWERIQATYDEAVARRASSHR